MAAPDVRLVAQEQGRRGVRQDQQAAQGPALGLARDLRPGGGGGVAVTAGVDVQGGQAQHRAGPGQGQAAQHPADHAGDHRQDERKAVARNRHADLVSNGSSRGA
jgi:hypothetical protein